MDNELGGVEGQTFYTMNPGVSCYLEDKEKVTKTDSIIREKIRKDVRWTN